MGEFLCYADTVLRLALIIPKNINFEYGEYILGGIQLQDVGENLFFHLKLL